ncbi:MULTISPECIES: SusC/RagA family TonB-linked outer membrane protein [Maribacter]|uniref:TonB-dependent receptor n=1 Tax=Maribacter flavus TaxID=1658664 RepID=A0A5B2TVV8_9FLAO|nr:MULTISPECIES: TonB-dependent receptor [Maribacter]KAA2218657.1 TonB-dependent receptor [Maribacter flavus]MDC6404670.1 TonB-dependent receptor [Maribacter sp. PR66]MEE1972084.1 TonB-dependent receptor [Maribacter flavus]
MKSTFFKGFLLFCAFLCIGLAKAQTVTGTVSDPMGPLPGASVLIKGTTTGTQTDFDGNYTLNNVNDNATLVFSYIGFKTVEVPVNGQSTIDVTMEEDASKLDEVVVTGYGSQAKKDLTGSVSVVDTEDLLAVPATTFAQQLQGRASGISIINDARPGGEATVRIRGFGTVGNNAPLYIVDGVPTQSQANFNPNDIESLQVLKDASAASIYGSRAANGVIIITTKKGKLGQPTISYNSYYGIGSPEKDPEALNARELGEYLYLADIYAGKVPSHGQYTFGPNGEVTIPDFVFPSGANEGDPGTDPSLYALEEGNIYAITRSADTNWWNEVTRSAPIQQHNISASGATESARYAFSLGYFEQDYLVKFASYNRISLRANTEFKAFNNKLTIGENFTASFDNQKGNFQNDQEQNAVSAAYKHHPLLPVRDIAGNFAGSRGANLGNNFNPFAVLSRDQDDRTYRLRLLGNVFADLAITPNLSIRSSFGLDSRVQRERDLGRPQPEYVEGNFINSSTAREEYEYQWTWTNGLTYTNTFNDAHNVTAFLGVESIQQFEERFGASRQRFAFETTNILSYLNLGNATTATNYGFVEQDYSLWSQFGRIDYDYNGKYLAQFTLRNDSSSRFQSASRSAIFPAFSLGWRISDESFMDNIGWIDNLKLRYGWGQTGNQQIGDYNAFTTFQSNIGTGGYPIDGNPSSPAIGFAPQAFGNPNAKWETTTTNNIGLDLTALDSRLSFEIDVYNRVTTDMLFQIPPTYTAGQADAPRFNVGGITNNGVDLALGFSDKKGDFGYSINTNFSHYTNNVDKLDDNPSTRFLGGSRRVPSLTVTQAGSPLSSFFGFKTVGIFQSQAEADAWPEYGTYNAPGKLKIADINGDGVINDDDRTVIGNPHPDFVYGINLDFTYKNLALNIFGNGSQGNDIYNYVRYFADFNTFQGNRSRRALYDAWQPTNPQADPSTWVAANPGATVPIMDANDQVSSRPSSYFVEDGSYFRIKNVQLTYNFTDNLLNSLPGVSRASVYIQGQNLATWTKYSGLNPEIQTPNSIDIGYDGGFMPVARTFLLGLNVTLN